MEGTVSGVEGTSRALAGRIVAPALKFSQGFEITISHLIVLPTLEPLFLLGNDIFNSHEAFVFLQLRAATPLPQIEIWDAHRRQLVVFNCLHRPAGGTCHTLPEGWRG